MKAKMNLVSVLVILCVLSVNAQMTYYYMGEKIPLTVDMNYVHIIADEDFIKSPSATRLFQELRLERDESKPAQGMVRLKLNAAREMSDYSKIAIPFSQIR